MFSFACTAVSEDNEEKMEEISDKKVGRKRNWVVGQKN